MPARHTSFGGSAFRSGLNSESSGRRKRVSARHQVKRLDRISKGVPFKTGPAEETGFLRSVRTSLEIRNFAGPHEPGLKSGPDVFADALVPRNTLVPWPAPRSSAPFPSQLHFRESADAEPAWRAGDVAAMVIVPPNGRVNRTSPLAVASCAAVISAISPAAGAKRAFTPRSSRTLNCPSKLIGHGDPDKPANGVRDNRRFGSGMGPRSGEGGQQQEKGGHHASGTV
jgi:hypothetical protein